MALKIMRSMLIRKKCNIKDGFDLGWATMCQQYVEVF